MVIESAGQALLATQRCERREVALSELRGPDMKPRGRGRAGKLCGTSATLLFGETERRANREQAHARRASEPVARRGANTKLFGRSTIANK